MPSNTTREPNKNVCENDSECKNNAKCVDIYDYKLKLLVTKCCNFPDQSCLKGEEKDKKKENDKDDIEKVRSSEEKL